LRKKQELNQMYHIGSHTSINDFSLVNKLGCQTAQLFVSGPKNYKMLNLETISENLKNSKVNSMFVHSSYVSRPWGEKKIALKHIQDELYACDSFPEVKGYVLHLPKDSPEVIKEGLKNIVSMKYKVPILLEPIGVKSHPTNTYETTEKINNLVDIIGFDYMKKHSIGFCIDTCHLFVTGQDVTYYDQVDLFLSKLRHKSLIKLFHLNGSLSDLGAGKDRHDYPFNETDKIWGHVKHSNSGMKRFLEFIKKKKIHGIIEKYDDTLLLEQSYKKLVKLYEAI